MLRTSTIKTSSATLRLTESDGAGVPVVMLHGTGTSRAAFEHQLSSPLATQHRLIALDLPGHGDSTDATDPRTYSLLGLRDTVAEALTALRLDRFILLGWSLGGHIGIELIDHPGLVGLMVCGAPPAGRGPLAMLRAFRPSWDMRLASKQEYTESDIARFFSLCFARGATPELLEAVRRTDGRVRPILVRSMMAGECSDQRLAVERARVPVALVNGRDEPFVRLSYLDSLAGPTLWHGVPLVIEEAGHAPFWDQPDVFNDLLSAFAADALEASEALPFRRSA